jgi:hypothetical protein
MARTIEHIQSQSLDVARKSSRSKPEGAAPIHSGFTNRTNTSVGAPPTGTPPDASSPLPTDPTIQGKHRPNLMVHPSMTRQQVADATFNGEGVLKEAVHSGSTKLPATVKES